MTINPISPNLVHLLSPSSTTSSDADRLAGAGAPEGSFANILTDALNTASQADAADKASALGLMMGQSDDLAALIIDAQKAELSLNLALQIRNKFVEAYNDIMRMQV